MEVVLGGFISALVGLALWAFLPRGVVLVRSVRAEDPTGRPTPDTWEIKNNSSLPVRITSVTVQSPATFDARSETFREVELPCREGEKLGVELSFDDDTTEIRRVDMGYPWSGLEVLPGDTLSATVLVNTTLRIAYRRAGRLGIFERRAIRVDGYV